MRGVNPQVQVQLVKADLIAGREHLGFAASNALQSFRGKHPRSKSLAVEYLLFISCQRQISKAINTLGVDREATKIVLAGLSKSKDALQELQMVSGSLLGDRDDSLIEIGSKRKLAHLKKAFDVSKIEMEAARFSGESDEMVLKRLIVERSALLSIPD